jgi:ABC-type dipeptide/oligopeptide/nickel transport system permease subunit
MTDSPQDLLAPRPIARDNPFTRSAAGVIGFIVLGVMVLACLLSLPHTLAAPDEVSYLADGAMVRTPGSPRYDFQDRNARQLPPSWWSRSADAEARARVHAVATARAMAALAKERRTSVELLEAAGVVPAPEMVGASAPFYLMGTDLLGRDLFVRCLAGGGISLTIGIAAAVLSVLLGTVYGAVSGYIGGRLDAFLMRVVDILYGLPYILLVVLLAVAVDSVVQNVETARVERAAALKTAYVKEKTGGLPDGGRTQTAIEAIKGEASRIYGSGELSNATVQAVNIVTLLVAIGGVSWLTMARVVRGQVLSLKSQPFMEAVAVLQAPAPESDGADHRLCYFDGAAGDPAGVVPELPWYRRAPAPPQLGKPRRGRAPGVERVQVQLVVAGISMCVAGGDSAGAELCRRRTAGSDGSQTRSTMNWRCSHAEPIRPEGLCAAGDDGGGRGVRLDGDVSAGSGVAATPGHGGEHRPGAEPGSAGVLEG